MNRSMNDILLRDTTEDDLPIFYRQQLDPEANHMAAFTREDPADRAAFDAYWEKIMGGETILVRTILYRGQVAGSVLSYVMFDELQVSYWLGREFWGKGIATQGLKMFLEVQDIRPIYARAAADNIPSIRVLEKCGFKQVGTERGFARARGKEIEEVVMGLGNVPDRS